jgi:glutamine synthetase
MTKEDIIRYIGPTINAQLTLTWDTEQTLVQMIEILDGETPTLDSFLEYVLGNAVDSIEDTTRHDGYIALENQFVLVNDQGEQVWG